MNEVAIPTQYRLRLRAIQEMEPAAFVAKLVRGCHQSLNIGPAWGRDYYALTIHRLLQANGFEVREYIELGGLPSSPRLIHGGRKLLNRAVPDFYLQPPFRVLRMHLRLARPFRLTGIQWLANRFPDFYELYLTFLFPARDLYFELEILKEA